MHHQLAVAALEQCSAGLGVRVGKGEAFATGFALGTLAGVAHLGGHVQPFSQRSRQEGILPIRVAHLAPKGLIRGVVQALRIAVRQQHTLAKGMDHALLIEQLQPRKFPQQEVSISVLEKGRAGEAPQAFSELLGVGKAACVIAHPGLEQIAQDEQGVCRLALQPGGQSRLSGRRVRPQVQVRDESKAPPRGRRLKGAKQAQTSTAFSMTSASSGTSSWKPLRPVRTFSMASTTSVPATTLPNTA